MKDTIKDDYFRKVLKHEFISDNALMEHVLDEEKIAINIRYINKNKLLPEIREDTLIKLAPEEYANDLSKFLEISEDKTTVATFYKNSEGQFILDSVYDLENQTFVPYDFAGSIYRIRFNKVNLKVK